MFMLRFDVAEIALDSIQVYSTCADSKIRQSLEDFIQEKVIFLHLATLLCETMTLNSQVRFLVFDMKYVTL